MTTPQNTDTATPHLRVAAAQALNNLALRKTMGSAMDGLVTKRHEAFPDPARENRLRNLGQAIKARALADLPDLLLEFEANCSRNGIVVHWAQSRSEAALCIRDILKDHNSQIIIKGKSMVSEEIDLNHVLEADGMEVVESDLGEFIIQLAKEAPSHIIAPAIHKNVAEIAALFAHHFPDTAPRTTDPEALVAFSREILRQKFQQADAGVSGVNFAIAETGTLCLIENEGNGRLSTTAPPLHIAVMGIEKIIAKRDDFPVLLELLTRSATGQPISNYVNMITSPRRAGERDGPTAIHLVLLDGNRTAIHRDPLMRQTLACIRCGACMNHCPIYARIGGHSYQSVYPGPIGKILTPQLGLDRPDMPHASTLCGACADKCPVRIPIPDILRELRHRQTSLKSSRRGIGARFDRMVWVLWAILQRNPLLYRIAARALTRYGNHVPLVLMGPFRSWARFRRRPYFSAETLHDAARQHGFADD